MFIIQGQLKSKREKQNSVSFKYLFQSIALLNAYKYMVYF